MEEMKVGCARPTGGPVGESVDEQKEEGKQPSKEVQSMIQVGKKAPDFAAPAYQKANSVRSNFLSIWEMGSALLLSG